MIKQWDSLVPVDEECVYPAIREAPRDAPSGDCWLWYRLGISQEPGSLGLITPPLLTQFSHSVMSDSLQPHGLQHTGSPVHHQLPEFAQTHGH